MLNMASDNKFKIGLVVMASGLGKRFGGNKLITNLEGKPLIKWTLESTENLFDKRVVVTRSSEVKDLCDNLHIECIIHDLPGRNDTIRLGLTSLMKEIDYCFFITGDQPLISTDTIIRLTQEATLYNDCIVRACFGNTVGSPVGFPSRYFNDLIALPEGKGGNWIIKEKQLQVHTCEVNDEFELWDVDTTLDLDKIINIINDRK